MSMIEPFMRRAGSRLMASGAESSSAGANYMFVIRHGERLDKSDPNWSSGALRPQDTPLSVRGVAQGRRLGKWLYGRLPVHAPLAIFASPFIRCVQTADAIASELEGLQRAGLHSASATRICIEPGLCEDMSYMSHLKCQEPWYLNAADLVCASNRVDLKYKPLRNVTFKRGPTYPGGCEETTPGGTLSRCNSIALELADHPLIRDGGTGLLVTHGCPSTHMVRSLCARPGGVELPPYADIKAGHYSGPPLQYTACTAMARDPIHRTWDLAPGFDLFSNEHDPRLASALRQKSEKVTRYVFAAHEDDVHADMDFTVPMDEFELDQRFIADAHAGDKVAIGDTGITITLPDEYANGDTVRVRAPASSEFMDYHRQMAAASP